MQSTRVGKSGTRNIRKRSGRSRAERRRANDRPGREEASEAEWKQGWNQGWKREAVKGGGKGEDCEEEENDEAGRGRAGVSEEDRGPRGTIRGGAGDRRRVRQRLRDSAA